MCSLMAMFLSVIVYSLLDFDCTYCAGVEFFYRPILNKLHKQFSVSRTFLTQITPNHLRLRFSLYSQSITVTPVCSPMPKASCTASQASDSSNASTCTVSLTVYSKVSMTLILAYEDLLDRVTGVEPAFSFHYALQVRSLRHYTRI